MAPAVNPIAPAAATVTVHPSRHDPTINTAAIPIPNGIATGMCRPMAIPHVSAVVKEMTGERTLNRPLNGSC